MDSDAPISPLYKVNFEGATFNDSGCAGLGVVVLDSLGYVIGALSK